MWPGSVAGRLVYGGLSQEALLFLALSGTGGTQAPSPQRRETVIWVRLWDDPPASCQREAVLSGVDDKWNPEMIAFRS